MISPAQPAFAVGLATKSTHILYCLITQLLSTPINATNNTVQTVTQQWRSGESPPITPFVMYAAGQQPGDPGQWRRLQLPTQSPQNKETLFRILCRQGWNLAIRCYRTVGIYLAACGNASRKLDRYLNSSPLGAIGMA
jgi:hypothetical protein